MASNEAGNGSVQAALDRLIEVDREVTLYGSIGSVLAWDQQTYMPRAAVDGRSRQLARLSELAHERWTSAEVGELLERVGANDESPDGGKNVPEPFRPFVREWYRQYSREAKLPTELVSKMTGATSRGMPVWQEARDAADFSRFRDHLQEIVDLNREKAEHLGYAEHPYDPLLDDFEPWTTTAEVSQVFDNLKERLVPLVERITSRPQVDDSFLHRKYPADQQQELSRRVLEVLGYDRSRGRLDRSAHPFTISLGPDDVRITSRFNESFLNAGLFGTIHEAGHALYELGMGEQFKGTMLAECASLGTHESQSRTWENIVGRSKAFWRFFLPSAREVFPEQLGDVGLEEFYRGINKVERSTNRVESDEVTYALHIILRFNLELGLVTGKLSVDDIPEAWNEGSRELLGVVPANDGEGCLQDIHWAMGAIGYFPTYALGNLYGAQFWRALQKDKPQVAEEIQAGELGGIRAWLGEHIHQHGRSKTAGELVRDVTGEALDPSYFVAYLEEKFGEVYGL